MSSQDALEDSGVPAQDGVQRKARRKALIDSKEAIEEVLLGAHRIAVSLGEIRAFRDANVSIAEWAILRAVGDRKGVPLREIGAAAGTSRQRIRKVLSDLQEKNLVTIGKPEGADRRLRTISSTPNTARVLASVSQQMQALLAGAQDKHNRRIAAAARTLDRLSKQVRRGLATDRPKRRSAPR